MKPYCGPLFVYASDDAERESDSVGQMGGRHTRGERVQSFGRVVSAYWKVRQFFLFAEQSLYMYYVPESIV